jgi:hypothetical protein
MYPTAGTTIRADLAIKVEEARAADKFLIGQMVMPPMPVGAKSGTYPKLKIAEAELMSAGSTLRSMTGSYGEVTRKWDSDTYDCLDRGLEEPIDDTAQKDLARFFNLEASSARWVDRNMRLDHEVRVAAAIFNTTNFGAATNSTVAYTQANLATIDFPADVIAAVERVNDIGAEANTIVLSSTVLNRVKRSTLMKEWIRGTIAGEADKPINATSIARSFADHGITQCYVGRARQNTAKKGQAKSIANIWSTTYVWVGYVNPAAKTPEDGGAGFTFYWSEEGGFFTPETYRNEGRRSNMVRVRQNTTEKVTDGTAGTLIATQYS